MTKLMEAKNQYFIDAIYYPLFGRPKYKKGVKVDVNNIYCY